MLLNLGTRFVIHPAVHNGSIKLVPFVDESEHAAFVNFRPSDGVVVLEGEDTSEEIEILVTHD